MSDAYIQVSVSMPGKPIVGYKIKIANVYGTFNQTTDSDQAFLRSIMGGLTKVFGGSVKVESVFHDEAVKKEPDTIDTFFKKPNDVVEKAPDVIENISHADAVKKEREVIHLDPVKKRGRPRKVK